MDTVQWTSRIEAKGMDPEALAGKMAGDPGAVALLLDGMGAKGARMKYGCGKVLRALAQGRPELVYPRFDDCVRFLSCDNAFLRWDMIRTLSYLAAVDRGSQFRRIFKRYFGLIGGPEMVAAANVLEGAPRIAEALPELREGIVREILKVEKARYRMHGAPSPECGRVACGHALEALGAMYPTLEDTRKVDAFIRRQTENPRQAVGRKARRLARELGL